MAMEASMEDGNGVIAKPREWWLTTREFFKDTSAEMKKVTWPSRNEVVGTTFVVIVATVIFAVYLWGCDQIFTQATLWLFDKFGAGV
jgi:preprotein translocase subunit SecE